MIELNGAIEIAHPAAGLWQIVADFGQDPRWRAGVITRAPDPPGLVVPGTTTDDSITLGGHVHYTGSVVTSVVADREFAWRMISGIDAEGSRSVVSLGGDRCLVAVHARIRLRGLQRLRGPVLKRVLEQKLQQDLHRLRDLVTARG